VSCERTTYPRALSCRPDLLPRLVRSFLRAGEPGHLTDVGVTPQRRPCLLDSAHRLIRGKLPRDKVPAVGGRMPDLHTGFVQQAANELKRQRLDCSRVRGAQVKPDRLDDAPQTHMILMTFLDKALQNIIRSHGRSP